MKPVEWCFSNDAYPMIPDTYWCLSVDDATSTMKTVRRWCLSNDACTMMPDKYWCLSFDDASLTIKEVGQQCLSNNTCQMKPVKWSLSKMPGKCWCLLVDDAYPTMKTVRQWRQSGNDVCPIMMPNHNLQTMPNDCQKILLFLTVNKCAMAIKKYWI